jgi:curved DNA-binding protein CbpA
VIRAAYKALAQKHHPDKNGNSEQSIRMMKIVNESYEVLSNPESRKRHDEWIARQKRDDRGGNSENNQRPKESTHDSEVPVGYITLAQFSKAKGIAESKVIEMIRDGFYVGRKVGGAWYVSLDELSGEDKNGFDAYIPVAQFSQIKGIPESKVVNMIRDGFYIGKKEGENWFVSASELEGGQSKKKEQGVGYEFRWLHFWVVLILINVLIAAAR